MKILKEKPTCIKNKNKTKQTLHQHINTDFFFGGGEGGGFSTKGVQELKHNRVLKKNTLIDSGNEGGYELKTLTI